jgi:hypothetical protein
MEEVHYGGKGPHWPVVPMKKKKNEIISGILSATYEMTKSEMDCRYVPYIIKFSSIKIIGNIN